MAFSCEHFLYIDVSDKYCGFELWIEQTYRESVTDIVSESDFPPPPELQLCRSESTLDTGLNDAQVLYTE